MAVKMVSNRQSTEGSKMLNIQNLTVAYDDTPVLTDVAVHFNAGKITGIISLQLKIMMKDSNSLQRMIDLYLRTLNLRHFIMVFATKL